MRILKRCTTHLPNAKNFHIHTLSVIITERFVMQTFQLLVLHFPTTDTYRTGIVHTSKRIYIFMRRTIRMPKFRMGILMKCIWNKYGVCAHAFVIVSLRVHGNRRDSLDATK